MHVTIPPPIISLSCRVHTHRTKLFLSIKIFNANLVGTTLCDNDPSTLYGTMVLVPYYDTMPYVPPTTTLMIVRRYFTILTNHRDPERDRTSSPDARAGLLFLGSGNSCVSLPHITSSKTKKNRKGVVP
eukprot:scaffold36338_cov191-Amphora_coffeaeformis.AAC.1